MEKIRIGLLGASRIARGAIIAPAADIEAVDVACVAARQPERAKAYADEHGIAEVETDYASLVTSDNVDLVYNALPPDGHAEWSIAALDAGKHVLCEKPFAMNADEARQMVAAAKASGRYLIEAFHYRFHPLFSRVLDILESGEVGRIVRIESRFDVPIPDTPGELRYDRGLGGGALMDLGCYPVHWARTVMGTEPVVTAAQAEWHESGVDISMAVDCEFAGGVSARLGCSMSEAAGNRFAAELVVIGESGTLAVRNPLAPHNGHTLSVDAAGDRRDEEVAGDTTYFHQLRHVVDVIEGRAAPLTGGIDAVNTMRVIDEAYRLARVASR